MCANQTNFYALDENIKQHWKKPPVILVEFSKLFILDSIWSLYKQKIFIKSSVDNKIKIESWIEKTFESECGA